jgi:addiction module HigA family antidote
MVRRLEITHTLPPLHPGEVLREEFIIPLGLTAGKVAKACGIARSRIERIVAEEIGISGDTAVRLGRVLGTGPELWMNLQSRYEIETARAAIGSELNELPTLNVAA